jgi:hypothetical protein
MTEQRSTICEICQRLVDTDGGEGYYQCIKCGQEICSECCDNAPDECCQVICDDCWPRDVKHSYDED